MGEFFLNESAKSYYDYYYYIWGLIGLHTNY